MPREAFEVIVGVSGKATRDMAIAAASRYLAYADQTDTFGYLSEIMGIQVYGREEEGDWGVGIHFNTPIENDDARERFMSELENLSRVESFERLAFEPV